MEIETHARHPEDWVAAQQGADLERHFDVMDFEMP